VLVDVFFKKLELTVNPMVSLNNSNNVCPCRRFFFFDDDEILIKIKVIYFNYAYSNPTNPNPGQHKGSHNASRPIRSHAIPYFLGTHTEGGRGKDHYGENQCGENPP
jgi:hypothetical protein